MQKQVPLKCIIVILCFAVNCTGNITNENQIKFKGNLYLADSSGYFPDTLVFIINPGKPLGMKVCKDFESHIIGESGDYKISLYRERIHANEYYFLKPKNMVKANFYIPLEFNDIPDTFRSEEHTSELQSHSFISYAVFCLKKKRIKKKKQKQIK